MTKRLVMTPAVGLFAGLSVFSYGAVNMLLSGVHETRQAATSPCSAAAPMSPAPTHTSTTRTLPGTRTASHVSGRAQHPAGMPVLLAHAVRLAAQSTPPTPPSTLPSSQPSPGASPPALPQPSPAQPASPGTSLPQPAPAQSPSEKNLTPGGTVKSPAATATSTPTSTPTGTPTPTSTPTSTPTPPPGTLCLQVQTLGNVSSVAPHTIVRYAIWVWLGGATNGTAKIALSASPRFVSPTFSVCVPSGRSHCTVSGLSTGHVELQAKLKAPGSSHRHVTLTATATSAQASNSATASATVDIKSRSSSSSPKQNAGDGTTLPPALPPTGLPSGTTVPGLGIQPTGDLGSAFPQVSPSPSASGTATANSGHSTKTIDLSAGLPLDVRLIGGQLVGLAVLAAAVTIAVARLSLRRQQPPSGGDGPGSS